MNDFSATPFPFANMGNMTENAKASFDAAAKAYSTWAKGANKLQVEAIRFVADRFRKDLALLNEFGSCRKPEEFLNLQSQAATQLVNDYLEEGAKWIALLGEVAQDQGKTAGKAK